MTVLAIRELIITMPAIKKAGVTEQAIRMAGVMEQAIRAEWDIVQARAAGIIQKRETARRMAQDVIMEGTDNERRSNMRSEQEANRAIEQYSDIVRKICMLHLKSHSDTEDIFQTVFLKYVLYSGLFENSEHEKAWIIRVTINACKDYLKSFFRSRTVPLDEITELAKEMPEEHSGVLEAVLSLPKKYKDVIYLYFYEQYTAVEISGILGKNVNTIYTLLARAKDILKDKLGGEGFE